MPDNLTLREMSDLTCDADGIVDAAERETRYQKFRVVTRHEHIRPITDDISRGKTAEYSVETLCIARLLIALYEDGLDNTALRDVVRAMLMAVDARLKLPAINGFFPPRGIDAVVATINDGSTWKLRLLKQKDRSTGQKNIVGGFIREDQLPYPANDPRSESAMWKRGTITLYEVTIYASNLLKPLLLKLNERTAT